nr:MAG TPA: hypothetical protein [Caudoviricetes sp.]
MAKIYKAVINEESARLVKLNLQQSMMSFSHLQYVAYLGLTDAPLIVENNRFATTLPGFAFAPPIMSGDGRAIDYNMRYKQFRKLYGFYISLGKSVYFHNYWISNIKRAVLMYMRNYQLSKREKIESSYTHNTTVYFKGIYDWEKYYGFKIIIENAYDKKEENKKILKYRKDNLPIYCYPTSKIEDIKYIDSFIGDRVVLKSKRIDRVLFKPVRLPIRDIKGMVKL